VAGNGPQRVHRQTWCVTSTTDKAENLRAVGINTNTNKNPEEREQQMSYNVRLDKNILASGRGFMHSFVPGGFIHGNKLPEGVGALLDTFISRAQATWKRYADSLSRDEFLQAMTFVSLAAENILRHDGMLSIFYHPKFPHAGVTLDEEQQNFCTHFSRSLTFMRYVIEQLLTASDGIEFSPDKVKDPDRESKVRMQLTYLSYAKHVADLAVSICVPPNYLYKHQFTSEWLKLRARTLRKTASLYIDAARTDEADIEADYKAKADEADAARRARSAK
jgi:hypothetical protein